MRWPWNRKETPEIRKDGRGISRRRYHGAAMDRLVAGFSTTNQASDAILRSDLAPLRARSRVLTRDNDYAKRYIRLAQKNIIGPQGIRMQARAKQRSGKLDRGANDRIEAAWKAWGRKEYCSYTQEYSWLDIQKLVVAALKRDGEILVRKVRGARANNPFSFSLDLIEADHLDENHVEELRNGNRIYMGVETNPQGRIVAYWLLDRHPGADASNVMNLRHRTRYPADEIIHVYDPDRVTQSRGVPGMHTSMRRLNMIGGYEESEIVAARAGASKMAAIMSPDGDYDADGEDDNGNLIEEFEPGLIMNLPMDSEIQMLDPQHPNSGFGSFIKSMLRGVAAGLNISYHGLSQDLESVNYSSLRQGALDERDDWQMDQALLVEHLCQPIADEWLFWALSTPSQHPDALDLPFSRYQKFRNISWQPRGWSWVDPAKEVTAHEKAVNLGVKSRHQIVRETGGDIEQVMDELALEKAMMEERGILPEPAALPESPTQTEGDEDDEED
tara:strand:- start:2744 stop:4246 length:1503 start_codon:yes stop_codon:yes gene_type:complete